MTVTNFFWKYSSSLLQVREDDPEYGNFMLLHPEEIDEAKSYADQKDKYVVVSVHETEDKHDFVDMSQPCDFGSQPHKYGYFIIEKFVPTEK